MLVAFTSLGTSESARLQNGLLQDSMDDDAWRYCLSSFVLMSIGVVVLRQYSRQKLIEWKLVSWGITLFYASLGFVYMSVTHWDFGHLEIFTHVLALIVAVAACYLAFVGLIILGNRPP
jgi:hypothetical protein